MVAKYHVHIMEKIPDPLPPLVSLPSFNKLGMNAESAISGIELLQAAQKRISEIRSLFVL